MIPSEWIPYLPKPNPLETGKKWNVFLSYRSVNRGWVLNLYDVLTELGFKVFLDQYVLKSGESLIATLQEGLSASQAGVLIWSNAAQDSAWIQNEYETMLSKSIDSKGQFKFIPIRIERLPLPPFANNRLFQDFTDYPDGPGGGELLRLVHGIIGQPLSPEAIRFAYEQDQASGIESVKINAAIRNGMPELLLQFFEEGGLPWRTTSTLACKAAEGLTKLDRNDEAIDMLLKTQSRFPSAIRPKQLRALALARRGKPDDLKNAQQILGELYAANHLDPETIGLYARTWMDRYKASGNDSYLRQSRNFYAEGFEKAPDDYYTGINAASKSIFLGDIEKGMAYAAAVQPLVGTTPVRGDYWKTATIAETLLIQKQYAEAGRMYQHAIDIAPEEKASHTSTFTQAERLCDALGATPEEKALALAPFNNFWPVNGEKKHSIEHG